MSCKVAPGRQSTQLRSGAFVLFVLARFCVSVCLCYHMLSVLVYARCVVSVSKFCHMLCLCTTCLSWGLISNAGVMVCSSMVFENGF